MSTSSSSGRKRIAGARQAHEAVDLRRQRQQRHQRALVVLALQLEDRREAAVRDERERMRRIDGERCQDREDLVDEILLEPGALGRRSARRRPARRCRPRATRPAASAQTRCCSAIRIEARSRIAASCSAGRQPVVAQHGRAVGQHVDEARHADHVEFVEVGGRNRQEAHPLEQRMAGVAGLLQDARVEREPRKLAIDETAWTIGRYGCSLFGRCGRAERIHGSYAQNGTVSS